MRFLSKSIPLPPTGWLLAGMLAFYVLAGLVGKDPWQGEDATHINIAWQILRTNDFFNLNIAGNSVFLPPLYYWSAACTGFLFSPFLPLHDAIRLASGFWVAAALAGLYYAGREIFGKECAAAAPMLLAGSIGLIIHAHDAQPVLIALTAHTAALGGLSAFVRKPKLGGIFYGLALFASLLGGGLAATLPIILLAFWAFFCPQPKNAALGLGLGFFLGFSLILLSFWAIQRFAPFYLSAWLESELDFLKKPFSFNHLQNALGFLALLPWFAFPSLPLALYALWRFPPKTRPYLTGLPLCLWALSSLVLAWAYYPAELPALLLLPPLALCATPAALALKRGAAALFDWFSICSFSLFCALAWVCWSAMHFGFPAKLSERIFVLRPGFAPELELLPLFFALLGTLFWVWLIVTLPRHSYSPLAHWTLGLTAFWFISALLILNWFNYGKSYRPMAERIAYILPRENPCLTQFALTNAQRAAFSYFIQLNPLPLDSAEGKRCPYLLSSHSFDFPILWEGFRAGKRRERFYLYKRF